MHEIVRIHVPNNTEQNIDTYVSSSSTIILQLMLF